MFTPGDDGRVRNTLLVTGPGIDTSYDKIHLFDAFGFAESDSVDAGTSPVAFEVNGTVIGLATCYDVRFPALFTANARAGAQVNIVCASWGAGEGKAEQWDLLVRARAVDSTTFVVACGQGDPASIGCRQPAPPPPASATAWWCPRLALPSLPWAANPNWWSWTLTRPSSQRSAESCRSWRTPGVSRPSTRKKEADDGAASRRRPFYRCPITRGQHQQRPTGRTP